jgi:hypothetical protein
MQLMKRASHFLTLLAVSGLLAGCFSYHREVSETTPAVSTPAANSTTTTTTTNDNGSMERQSTTTYSNP